MKLEVELEEGDRLETDVASWSVERVYEDRGHEKVRLYNDWRAQYEEYKKEDLQEALEDEVSKIAVFKG